MNPSEIKEIILKVNGEQAEQEIKRIKGAIENARAEKKKFEEANPNTKDWTNEQRNSGSLSTRRLPPEKGSSKSTVRVPTKWSKY